MTRRISLSSASSTASTSRSSTPRSLRSFSAKLGTKIWASQVEVNYEITQCRPEMQALVARPQDVDPTLWPWQIQGVPVPCARPGEVLVKVRAASVTTDDMNLFHHHHRIAVCGEPSVAQDVSANMYVPGCEIAGTVFAVGEDVGGFTSGDAVLGVAHAGGGCAQFVAIEEAYVMQKPKKLSFTDAAFFSYAALTALEALELASSCLPMSSPHILVSWGHSGVGSMIVQVARLLYGAEVAVVICDPESEAQARGCHPTHVIDITRGGGIASALETSSFDAAFDTIGVAANLAPFVRAKGMVVSNASVPTDRILNDKASTIPRQLQARLRTELAQLTHICDNADVSYEFFFPNQDLDRMAMLKGLIRKQDLKPCVSPSVLSMSDPDKVKRAIKELECKSILLTF